MLSRMVKKLKQRKLDPHLLIGPLGRQIGVRHARALLRSNRTKLTIPLWGHHTRALSHQVLIQGEALVFFRVKGER